MDPARDVSKQRDRPAENPYFFSNGGSPFLKRRESSVSQGDEDEIFEDARETWDPEPLPTTIDGIDTRSWAATNPQSERGNHAGAKSERPSFRDHFDSRAAQPSRTLHRDVSIRTQAAGGGGTVSSRHVGDGIGLWQQTARFFPSTPSISITSSDGYPSRPQERSCNVTPAINQEQYTDTRYDKECEVCKKHVRHIWYCNVCRYLFCNACWDALFLHRQLPKKGRGETPHEKTDPTVAEKVQKVMSPPSDDWAREQLYRDDEVTSWFGMDLRADFFRRYS